MSFGAPLSDEFVNFVVLKAMSCDGFVVEANFTGGHAGIFGHHAVAIFGE